MYEREAIIRSVDNHLAKKPMSSLREIAVSLGISRNSIERKLRAAGLRFRDMRAKAVVERSERALAAAPRTKKEVAYELGFRSANAFSQFLRRHQGRDRGKPGD